MQHIRREASLTRLARANCNPLELTALVRFEAQLRKTTLHVRLVVIDQVPDNSLVVVAFIDAHVRCIDIDRQMIKLQPAGIIIVVHQKGEYYSHSKPHGRGTSRTHSCERALQMIHIAR